MIGRRVTLRGEPFTVVGVMAPGQQVNPLDSWLGGAGKDVAQLKQDRDTDHQRCAGQPDRAVPAEEGR